MKLEYIQLNPFGGQSNRREDLNGNLHVICGPNDTGKSTVYEGIRHTLFTPVALRRNSTLYTEIEKFFPLPDGNMASCELGFTHDGVSYKLQKTWSATSSARSVRLIIGSGNAISGDEPVREKLAELLPTAEGTVKSVLMSWQGSLHETLGELTQVDGGLSAVHDLNDMLQAAVLDHGGVSQARFMELVTDNLVGNAERKIKGCSGRWDFQAQRPEGNNRGINNQWKTGVGEILEAWYLWETVKSAHEEATRLERDLDDANNAYCEKNQELKSIRQYVNEHRHVFNALQKRKALTAKIEAEAIKIKDLDKDSTNWANAGLTQTNEASQIKQLESREKELSKEEDKARTVQSLQAVKEKHRHVKVLKGALAGIQRELESAMPITNKVVKEYEEAFDTLRRAELVTQTGKLQLDFLAYCDQNIKVTRDFTAAEDTHVFPARPMQVEAGARITLEHADWALRVTSGNVDVAQLERDAASARKKLDELAQTYHLRQMDQVRQANQQYATAQARLQGKQRELDEALGTDMWEDLERQMQDAGDLTGGRPLDVVVGELTALRGQLDQKRQAVRDAGLVVSEMIKKHGDQKQLRSALSAAETYEETFKGQLAELPAVAEGIDEDEFERRYTEKEKLIDPLQDQLQEFRNTCNDIESRLPQESSEEIAQKLESAERAYRKATAKAKALQRILQAIEQVNDQSGSRHAEVKDRLEALVAQITRGRYHQATMDSEYRVVPGGFIRNDNVEIPFNILSQGTRDAVAVAVRLTMAEHFLKDGEGFFILDDPLVNLDSDRQLLVAQVLRDLAQEQQVVVFTCHEGHREMLA
jgi:exonuclease SbcC